MRRGGIIAPKILLRGLLIALAILFLQFPNYAMGQQTTVVTYNLFIGAEIQSLAKITDPGLFLFGVKDALDQMAANDFTERAEAIAATIVEKDPELIGLQEVYNIRINNMNDQPPFRNYQNDLINALADQGACYTHAATVTNLDLSFGPISVPSYGPNISITDNDVILRRCDVTTTVVDLTEYPLCRASADGCNYDTVAVANTPLGPIPFERGYVAVDMIGNFPVRFFNTHLEVRLPDPDQPLSALIQSAQAAELIGLLNFLGPAPGPVIVAGDINSSPEDEIFDIGPFTKVPPYTQFVFAGYSDAWELRPGKPKGFTCCFDEDLSFPADLYERIDMIFSDVIPNRVKANVLGNDEADQTPSGLWPSDHAGMAARMEF
jgi:endonuclease/exonuclease/phosphatase family metal-dependent hydrolase